jgi:hypothetical protein
VEYVNERRGLAVLRRQAKLVVLAALGVVAEAILAFLFLNQRVAAGGQSVLAVQFDVRAVGEDDGLAGV